MDVSWSEHSADGAARDMRHQCAHHALPKAFHSPLPTPASQETSLADPGSCCGRRGGKKCYVEFAILMILYF